MNPVWLSSDLWLRGWIFGIGRIITCFVSIQYAWGGGAGELFRFVPHSEDLMYAASNNS